MTPHEIVKMVHVDGSVFTLVPVRGQRLTLRHQQLRATNAVAALATTGRLCRGQKIAVVGGGVCGLTACAMIVEMGVSDAHPVHLLEQGDDILWNLQGCTKRWLHPRLFTWPRTGWRVPVCDTLVLPWTAGYAGDVRRELYEQYLLEYKKRVRLRLGVRVDAVTADGTLEVAERAGRGVARERFDLVLLATGPGLERRLAGHGWVHTYWQDDSLDQLEPSHRVRWPKPNVDVAIGGLGDGAITDLLRARLRDFRHGEIEEIVSYTSREYPREVEELLDLELRAKDPKRGLRPVLWRRLESRMRTLAAKVLAAKASSLILRDNHVLLIGPRGPFAETASTLSRYLLAVLLEAERLPGSSGRTEYVDAVATPDIVQAGESPVIHLPNGKAPRVAKRYVHRAGVEPVPAGLGGPRRPDGADAPWACAQADLARDRHRDDLDDRRDPILCADVSHTWTGAAQRVSARLRTLSERRSRAGPPRLRTLLAGLEPRHLQWVHGPWTETIGVHPPPSLFVGRTGGLRGDVVRVAVVTDEVLVEARVVEHRPWLLPFGDERLAIVLSALDEEDEPHPDLLRAWSDGATAVVTCDHPDLVSGRRLARLCGEVGLAWVARRPAGSGPAGVVTLEIVEAET